MTQDEIIEMADKADDLADAQLQMKGEFHPDWHTVRDEIFAKLVAEKEREACAKDCEDIDSSSDYYGERVELFCAEVIRARGQV